ncbi:hypothetical protein AB0B25_31755 [Nocardia sp. NPDC049190]|uniref:hypothetical protein n=1 Tax=Nocardia sp. NPDC049190 TaxID=3155650 RepID=UPI003402ABA9
MTYDKTESPQVVATDSYRTIEDPSETQLHDILADMNARAPFVIVDRFDSREPGDHYIQVRLDEQVDPGQGHCYIVERRDGGPSKYYRATISDDRPWGSGSSAAFDTVVNAVQDWAFRREGWRTALGWEQIKLDDCPDLNDDLVE